MRLLFSGSMMRWNILYIWYIVYYNILYDIYYNILYITYYIYIYLRKRYLYIYKNILSVYKVQDRRTIFAKIEQFSYVTGSRVRSIVSSRNPIGPAVNGGTKILSALKCARRINIYTHTRDSYVCTLHKTLSCRLISIFVSSKWRARKIELS